MPRLANQLAVALAFLFVCASAFGVDIPSIIDFGRTPHDEHVTATVELENESDAPVYFDFMSTCPCVIVDPASLSVASGESATVEFTLDPRQYEGEIEKAVLFRSSREDADRGLLRVTAFVTRPTDADAEGCTDCEILAESIQEQGYRHWLNENWVVADVYYTEGCHECEELIERTIPRIEDSLNIRVSVRRHNVLEPDQYELLMAEVDRREVDLRGFPVVTVGDTLLSGGELTTDSLRSALAAASGKNPDTAAPLPARRAGPNAAEREAGTGHGTLVDRLAVVPVLVAGLVDGVNPCAFATLLFLLSSLTVVGKNRREILAIGAIFASAVFITYFAVGLGLFHALRAASVFPLIAATIRWLMVALLTVFAGLSVYDYVLVKQGKASKMVLQLPDRFKRRIHASVRRGVRGYSLVAGAAAMGFAVSIFELGCTGQVYFPTISYMVQSGGGFTGYGLLVVYNLGFIAPLLALFAAVYVGIGSDGLLRFFRANLGRLKLALAVVFVVLAVFTALP